MKTGLLLLRVIKEMRKPKHRVLSSLPEVTGKQMVLLKLNAGGWLQRQLLAPKSPGALAICAVTRPNITNSLE